MAVVKNLGPFATGTGEDITITDRVSTAGTSASTATDVTGWQGAMFIKRRATDTSAVITKTFTVASAAAGLLSVSIAASSVANLEDAAYCYTIARTDSGAFATLTQGTITFRKAP